MDAALVLRALGALATVLGLLAAVPFLVRRYGGRFGFVAGAGAAAAPRRLAVLERLAVDPRRQLLLVRRDGQAHLILLSPEGPLLVEAGIAAEVAP